MKTIVHLFLVFIATQSITNAQCGIHYDEILREKCSGVYLRHQDFSNTKNKEIKLVLKQDNKYAIYLLNPSKSLPDLSLSDTNAFSLKDFHKSVNTVENYALYTFTVIQTAEYGFNLDFKTADKACVLLAIFLRNDNNYKPGIYKNFDEFRYGNPSIEFNCQVINKKQNSGKGKLDYYKLDMNNKRRQEIGKVFGFNDGKNVYVDITYPKLTSNPEFVKMEYLYKYYFYEFVKYIPVYSGSTATVAPTLVQTLLDINTGEVKVLNRKTLREILADDQALLEEFNNVSGKDKVLKEYLVKYLEKHNSN